MQMVGYKINIQKPFLFVNPTNKQLGGKPCKNNIYVSNTYCKVLKNICSKHCFKNYIEKIVQALKDTLDDKQTETYAISMNEEAFF